MQEVLLLGNSTTAEVLFKFLMADSRFKVIGFCAESSYIKDQSMCGLPVWPIENIEDYLPANDCKVIMACGYTQLNKLRSRLASVMLSKNFEIITYIHPDANYYGEEIGWGGLLLPGCVIEPMVKIGNLVNVWSNCTIAHESILEDNCWVASGAVVAGKSKIGESSFLGVNSTIANNISVGKNNIIGSNTSIQKPTNDNEVYLSSNGEKLRYSATDYATYFLT